MALGLALLLLVSVDASAQAWKDKLPGIAKNIAQNADWSDLTPEEETALGREISARILGRYKLVDDPKLTRYVTLVGRTVAYYSDRPELTFRFAVLDSDIVNAFSAPGGYVFITRGALAVMSSEAELAAVLGHEIAHITGRHILAELKRGKIVATTTEAMNLSDSKVGEAIKNKVSSLLFDKGLSKRDENDADEHAVEFLSRAGYGAGGMRAFLDVLAAAETGANRAGGLEMLTRTHPRAKNRIERLAEQLRENPGLAAGGADLAPRFVANVKR